MHFQAIFTAPFGALGIACDHQAISEVRFLPPGTKTMAPENSLAERAVEQLSQWLSTPDAPFDLPLQAAGTPFQRRVWAEIAHIDLGEVRTYGDIARTLGSAAQAVGQACGANPFPIVIPCHRVVARRSLGGFAGERDGFLIHTKQWLLQFEANRAGR